MKTTQKIRTNLHLVSHFQSTILNIAINHNMHHIAMYRDIIASRPTYRDAYRIMKFLPILSPTIQIGIVCH